MTTEDNSKEPRAHSLDNVGDWFAVGSVFTPFHVPHNDVILTGMRDLLCLDTGSHYIMFHATLQKRPATLTSKDLLFFLAKVMTDIGIPRKGFVILKSAYLSSAALAADEDTRIQGQFLRDIHCVFDEMRAEDKKTIAEKIRVANTSCIFQGLARIESDVTLAFSEMRKIKN